MSPEQWQHVGSLFEAALARDQDQRVDFVVGWPEDPDVRDEVLRLLREYASMDSGFLAPRGRETLLDGLVRTLIETPATSYQGQLLGGRYFVEKEIGRGGSGVVYLAQDRQLHSRPVVIKVPHAMWDDHERVRLRFRREIEALSRINHPAVVGVLDVGQAADGRFFLVMEYVDGVTLRSRLNEGPLSFAEVSAISATVCDALETAHSNGIIHRDVKPENIIVPAARENMAAAKLIDFGIAKVHNSIHEANTETVTVMGTLRYLAPEQLMGRSVPQSDIYALGAVCYEMLTGCHPFDPETPFQLYELQKAGKVIPPSKLCKGVPTSADLAVLRALCFRPEERQASASQFAVEFRASSRRWSTATLRLCAALALLLIFIAAGWRFWDHGWGTYENVIEFAGARNPEDFGFHSRLDLVEHAVHNPERTGYDAIRLLSEDQGYYYRKLTHAQCYAALSKGWTLEAVVKAVEGQGCAGLDLTPAPVRYAVCVMRNPSHRQVVQLITRLEEAIEGPTCELFGPEEAWHDYQLIFDAHTQKARLLVDGVERLRNYGGFREYLEGWGLTFSTAIYKSSRAETLFKRVRFQINP